MYDKPSRIEGLISECQSQVSSTETKASFVIAGTALFTVMGLQMEEHLPWIARASQVLAFLFALLCIWPRLKLQEDEISPISKFDHAEFDANKYYVGRAAHFLSLQKILKTKRLRLRIALSMLVVTMVCRAIEIWVLPLLN